MKKQLILSMMTVCLFQTLQAGTPVEEGKKVFTTRCASCHSVNKVLVGPALAHVDQRHSIAWIVDFVHSPRTVISKGDPAAVALYASFNNITMPDHTDLSAADIRNVVEYIKSQPVAAKEDKKPFDRPGKWRPNYLPLSINNYEFFFEYALVVAMLVFALLLLVRVKEYARDVATRK